MATYLVNEIFYSIQGEGRNTGMPAWFIRLAGCNLNCYWCDTDHSVKEKLNEYQIVHRLLSNLCRNVIITGGEPALQDLKPLLKQLKADSCYVAIETNGTQSLLQYRIEGLLDWVTVSPKVLPVKVDCIIDEIKVIWPCCFLKQCEPINSRYYYIQPCDDENKEANTKMAIETVKQNPKWRLSLQIQKILQFR